MLKKSVFGSIVISTALFLLSPIDAEEQERPDNQQQKYNKNSAQAQTKEDQQKLPKEEPIISEPVKATTENGENVLLYSDGTWEFSSEEPVQSIKRTINKQKFRKPSASREVITGSAVGYEIHYDKEKWQLLNKNINEMAEYSLLHLDKNAYAIVIPEKTKIPLKTLRDIVISNAKSVSNEVAVIKEEERTVNGEPVIMINIKANVQGMSFIYMYYIYSGEKASIQVIGFTTEELYEDYKKDIEDFLNGLIIRKASKPELKTIKENKAAD